MRSALLAEGFRKPNTCHREATTILGSPNASRRKRYGFVIINAKTAVMTSALA
jgi:hypothetical protein